MKTNPIYIIHGWTYRLDKWQPTFESLKQARVEFKVLRVPGLVGPNRPADQSQVWTIDHYLDWLDEQLPNKKVILVAHSNGGRIALNYCAQRPALAQHKLQQLILIGSAGVLPSRAHRLKRSILIGLVKIAKPLAKIQPLAKIGQRLVGSPDWRTANAGMKKTMANMLASDYQLDFGKVKIPVSLIWGDCDTATPLWQAKVMQSRLPQALNLDIIQGAGHTPYLTHPEQLVAIIQALIRNNVKLK